ncbi:MAG TPA: TonB-dependent receptor [Opitutaceae bacterium]|nr:TonB-dependent receptor [Opitutaceae bacterium]
MKPIFPALLVIPFAAFAADSQPVEKLSPVVVTEAPSIADKYQLPQVTESITATRIEETINAVDTEDALKYFPSIFLRKRNYGDTQPTLASRVWGVSSSARSLVYADGVLLTALIANNNNIGAPRWGLIAPAEIERMDMMYGPFAAQYPGNSMGAVLEITTRMPERFEGSVTQTTAWQDFSLYGTRKRYATSQTALALGDRAGKFSYWISANYQDSHSQPLSYVTNATFPAGTTGGFAANNKLGAAANIMGASGLLHTEMTNAKLKLAFDFAPALRASYTFGAWHNDADAAVETYLRNSAGAPTFAGLAGFASGRSTLVQDHTAHSLTLRSDRRGAFDFEVGASLYRIDRDEQRSPLAASALAAAAPDFGSAGRLAVLGGSGWNTLDAKGTWRVDSTENSAHVVTFGAHDDRYKLYNPTFATAEWRAGDATSVASEGDGKTRTQALWAQDAWTLTHAVKLTLGTRYETWRAYDGLNINGATVVRQPTLARKNFSPKATLTWTISPGWSATFSAGQAYRYATAAELYQLVTTGTTFTSPKPDLKPDAVLATELKLERKLAAGRVRLSLFEDDIHDAIVAQFNPLVPGSTQLFSFLSNVDHVRARGAELVIEKNNLAIRGLEFTGSVTYLDARTLALSGRASATAAPGAAIGKKLPNIPDWRATFVVTYRVRDRWTFTAAGRYSGKLWTTLDNTDTNPNTWQGFAAWFVADARVHYRGGERWSASLGVDNVLDRKYFLFHPFPQRTVVVEGKFVF